MRKSCFFPTNNNPTTYEGSAGSSISPTNLFLISLLAQFTSQMVRSRADDSLLWIPHCTNPQKDWVKSYYNSCMFVFYLLVSTVVWSQLKAPWDPSNWPAGLWPCSRDCSGWLGSWMSTWKDWSVEQYRCGTCSLQETDVSWTKSASRFALLADSMLYTLGVSIWKLQQSTTPGSMLKQKHWDKKSCGKPNHEPSPTRLVARYTPISDYLGDPYYWIYDGLPHCMYIYIHYYIDRERERSLWILIPWHNLSNLQNVKATPTVFFGRWKRPVPGRNWI